MIGCHSKKLDPAVTIERKGNQLYEYYLAGGTNEARSALNEILRLGKSSNLPKSYQDRWFYLAYSRLFALEYRCGNHVIADNCFASAKYYLKRMHIDDGEPMQEIESDVAQFTPENCVLYVDKWDRAHSDGRGANYLHKIGGFSTKDTVLVK